MGIERRLHPRFGLYAVARLEHAQLTYLMSVRNISAGGVLLSADHNDLSTLLEGTRHEVAIFDPGERKRQIKVFAHVTRNERARIAFTWNEDAGAILKVEAFLDEVRQ